MIARHNLLLVDEAGREHALRVAGGGAGELVSRLIRDLRIPPIVKRQEATTPAGHVEVGFSSYLYENGVRLRVASLVPAESIGNVYTPFDVMRGVWQQCWPCDAALMQKLFALCELGARSGVEVGLFGSAALHVVTGYPYWNARSDIDAVVRGGADGGLRLFSALLQSEAVLRDSRLDIELEMMDGYSVKLCELFSEQKTVLAKGIADVKLIDRMSLVGRYLHEG